MKMNKQTNSSLLPLLRRGLGGGVIAVCLLLTAVTAQATDTLPQGLWTVERVIIEKIIEGSLQTIEYNSTGEIESNFPCPQEWEIDEQVIILRYASGVEELTEYMLEDEQLTITAEGDMLQYRYSLTDNIITLLFEHDYAYNQPEEQEELANEKWIITLKKID
jgi:hypothetical protein